MTTTGHEQLLIFGYSRDSIKDMEVASMRRMWAVAGYHLLFQESCDVSELFLQLFPEVGSTWDGSEFTCIAILTDGKTLEQRITIRVKCTHARKLCVMSVLLRFRFTYRQVRQLIFL